MTDRTRSGCGGVRRTDIAIAETAVAAPNAETWQSWGSLTEAWTP